MLLAEKPSLSSSAPSAESRTSGPRVASIDALRGMVMFTMIFVNDLAGAPNRIVPAWMKHYHGKSGMTFVDLVFPAFLFIVGMSLPFALGARLTKGEPVWRVLGHVLGRTFWLLAIGILMVNETPDSTKLGWSGALWCLLMYLSALLALSDVGSGRKGDVTGNRQGLRAGVNWFLKLVGGAGLIWLALVFRGEHGQRIITFSPFSIHTEWFGILGLIGWAYLVGSLVFLFFGSNRSALLGCAVLLMCLYPADRTGVFDGFWLGRYVSIGETLGSQAAITVSGLLLASMLADLNKKSSGERIRFALLFIGGMAAAALLLHGLYRINKNAATPSWCLWACAITAALWLPFHLLIDQGPGGERVLKPLVLAGRNVLLAYLLSEMLPSFLECLGVDGWYDSLASANLAGAVTRSAFCGMVLLAVAVGLNRAGFRVRL